MSVNAMKLALGLASLGHVCLIERVPTRPPRVPENLRMLYVIIIRHFPSQLAAAGWAHAVVGSFVPGPGGGGACAACGRGEQGGEG